MFSLLFGSRMSCERAISVVLRRVVAPLISSPRSMQRLRDSRRWSVFDPVDVPLLFETVGLDFTAAYVEYETSGLATRDYDIDVLWTVIVDSQRETGCPFLLFQDNINGLSLTHTPLLNADESSILASVTQTVTTRAISVSFVRPICAQRLCSSLRPPARPSAGSRPCRCRSVSTMMERSILIGCSAL